MIEHVISRIGGVGNYGIISICLFFAVFLGVIVWTLGLTRPYVERMSELPLDGSSGPEADAGPTPNPENRND